MARRNTRRRGNNNKKKSPQWRRMDLHLHTPGSSDYQEPHVTYLDILRQAMIRGLDIVAFTDHNTVAGFAAMKEEIQKLLLLEELGRIEPDEQHRLEEYRRILDKLLVLPGFEFTATFGFHILGLFPPETPVSYLEHLLLTLNIPPDQLRLGSSTVGATTDVLTAYRVINEAGGIVIAAHANSNHGVVMRGLDIGGQTRIAYTQDPNLHVLEVTDLEKRGRYTTRRFFDGSKPEYPRPMRCIQGSDAHRLTRESNTNRNLGVGDRVTEILLDEVSFDSLADVLKGNDLSRTRPYRGPAKAVDYVLFAREEGESIVQSFHESMAQRGGYFDGILRDICAMANTNGGTIYVGLSAETDTKPVGIRDPKRAVSRLEAQIENRFSPVPQVTIDTLPTQGTKVVRITVNPGPDIPYAIDSNLFYVRDEAETTLAVRDEIVQLVEKHFVANPSAEAPPPTPAETSSTPAVSAEVPTTRSSNRPRKPRVEPPRTGVQIVDRETRKGTIYYSLKDLRNGNIIQNVTKASARKLWRYAITQDESGAVKPDRIKWQNNNMAVLNTRTKGDNTWYDLALRDGSDVHVYFGVTDSGLNDDWLKLIESSNGN